MLSRGLPVRFGPGAIQFNFMRLRAKITILVFIGLLLFFSYAYIFFTTQGKHILCQELKEAINKEVKIGSVYLRFPLTFIAKNIEINNLARIDYVAVSPSIYGLLRRRIVLNNIEIHRPCLNLEKSGASQETTQESLALPLLPVDSVTISSDSIEEKPEEETKSLPQIIIKRLNINNGRLSFIDKTVPEPGIHITVEDIFFELDDLYLVAQSAVAHFTLQARFPWEGSKEEGKISANGWLNLYKKDMQAQLVIRSFDGVYLSPYFSYWIDVEKARIAKAKLNFISNISAYNNDVVAQCHLELTDIDFKARPEGEAEARAEKIRDAVLGIFRALGQGKVELDFTIKTKMDEPFGFNFVDGIADAFETKVTRGRRSEKIEIEDVAMLPGRLLGGMAKGATDATIAVIDGALAVGKSLTEAILGVFKKSPSPQE